MLPLEGIRVLDFGTALYGSMCGQWLGHLGADVIKVEPLEGEFGRLTRQVNTDSVMFHSANLCKRSLAVNLNDPRGREIVFRLAKDADVIVENFRVGVMQKLGLDYETISKANPRIIYGSFTAYGESGPLAHRRAGDHFIQAMSGVVAAQGSPDGPPYLAGHHFVDNGGAAISALAILTALFVRGRTGMGQRVTGNLLNSAMYMQGASIDEFLMAGRLFKKGGRGHAAGWFPYGAYPAKDGDVVTIFGQDDAEWPVVCKMLGIEHLLGDPRYDTAEKRMERKFELYPILDEAFRKRTREEWQRIFQENGLRCDPCLDYAELVAHPQFQANDMVVEVEHPRSGPLRLIGPPIKFQGTPLPRRVRHAPVLAQHTREILLALGYAEDDIERLHEEGVVAIASPEMLEPNREKPESVGTNPWGKGSRQAT